MKTVSVNETSVVEYIDVSDKFFSKDTAFEFIGSVASISYGRQLRGDSAIRLTEKLIEKGHYSPLEFIRLPIKWLSRKSDDSPRELSSGDFDISNSFRNNIMEYHAFWKTRNNSICSFLKPYISLYVYCFKIRCPIYVARQFMRHRAFSYMERSLRKTKNFVFCIPDSFLDSREAVDVLMEMIVNSVRSYEKLIDLGFRKEYARIVLPLFLLTEFYVIGDLDSWRNFLNQRLSKEAQGDIRDIAMKIKEYIKEG